MKTFDLAIKNEKEKYYRLFILLLIILHFVFFIYLLFVPGEWKRAAAGIAIILLYTAWRWWVTRKSKQRFSMGHGIFAAMAIVFAFMPWAMVAELLLSILSNFALHRVIWRFDRTSVATIGYPWKRYPWNKLENVVLKDDMLTIDHRNNKLFQAEVEKNESEAAFNTFAQEMLAS